MVYTHDRESILDAAQTEMNVKVDKVNIVTINRCASTTDPRTSQINVSNTYYTTLN